MTKSKKFHYVKFTPKVIQEAWSILDAFLNDKQRTPRAQILSVEIENEEWNHDTESEFFADYSKKISYAHYYKKVSEFIIQIVFHHSTTTLSITAPERAKIETIHQLFEKNVKECALPIPKDTKPIKMEPIIFIGHGQSEQWRDLKDHLHEKHRYHIEAYEIGARAGHEIRDVLEKMLNISSFAILVMTGEDKDEEGNLHARENVIHELGLFQGNLGFSKAIILLEEGTQEFSNIQGIQQIRYSKGRIKETFGEVLATLKREFE